MSEVLDVEIRERLARLEGLLQGESRHLATKADVQSVKVDVEAIRSELRALRWLLGIGLTAGVAGVNLLIRFLWP